jgi:hypothetical protein
MPNDIRRPGHAPVRSLIAVEPRFALSFCVVLLTGASALASLVFACATPFAAYAVVAGAMLPLPPALAVVAATWLVNQAIGFGMLGYPFDANTIVWGVAIGAAALLSTTISKLVLRSFTRLGAAAALGLALAAAYAIYEIALLAFTPALGGAGAFALPIVARLLFLNALWLIALVAVCTVIGLVAGARQRPALS